MYGFACVYVCLSTSTYTLACIYGLSTSTRGLPFEFLPRTHTQVNRKIPSPITIHAKSADDSSNFEEYDEHEVGTRGCHTLLGGDVCGCVAKSKWITATVQHKKVGLLHTVFISLFCV